LFIARVVIALGTAVWSGMGTAVTQADRCDPTAIGFVQDPGGRTRITHRTCDPIGPRHCGHDPRDDEWRRAQYEQRKLQRDTQVARLWLYTSLASLRATWR
jgi:hypothetical protein